MPPFLRRSGFFTVLVLSLLVAGFAIFAYTALPLGSTVHPDMRVNFEAHRIGIYTHIFCSAIALLLGPFQFSSRLRRSRPAIHRATGRIYLGVGVAIGGLSGLYMAAYAHGGIVSKLGFATLAVLWLYTGARAYAAARGGDFAAHRSWMIFNFALTFAAVTLRIHLLAFFIAGFRFESFYPFIAWLAWVPNMLVAAFIVRRSKNQTIVMEPSSS